MKNSIMRVLAAALLPALIIGCATLGTDFEKPYVHLSAIRLVEIKGLESIFQVDLRIVNPNGIALPIRGVEADLNLEGRHIAKGVANPQKEIAAYSSEIVPVTVYASMLGMIGLARRLLGDAGKDGTPEVWAYAVKGHLRLDESLWMNRIPFDSQGEIDLEELTGDGAEID